LGNETLEKFIERDYTEDNDNFARFFKSLAFVPAENISASIIGYDLADSAFTMTLHYHEMHEYKVNKTIVLTANTERQYNKINTDRSSTPFLHEIDRRNFEISSYQTGNQSYIQSGTPLYAKLQFPSIDHLREIGQYGKIVQAVLRIRPIRNSYNEHTPLPAKLNLRMLNESGYMSPNYITNANGSVQTGNLFIDNLYRENTCYTFDISSFLNAQLGAPSSGKYSLLLIIPENEEATTIKRLVIGDTKNDKEINRMQLEIHYTSIKTDE
jgi:hypothetical protein